MVPCCRKKNCQTSDIMIATVEAAQGTIRTTRKKVSPRR